mmetsp:Transcript_39434/g.91051  ORF Transcript_39434/g.91051 Transcript_39434/m.91051 type:complete len:131 (+) Transcript_39434:392-784(+)
MLSEGTLLSAAFLGSLRIHSCRDHCDDLDVEVRIADGVDLNFVKGRGLGLSNVKAMLGYMEADLPRASVLAQVVPQSALDANDIEGSSIPSDFQPRLGHVKMTSMLRSPTPLQSICHRSRARNSTCVEVM